jgi:isoaspartyl peptidase/L-asparaginase-like protein (Ntn-hydrolase superfamily)
MPNRRKFLKNTALAVSGALLSGKGLTKGCLSDNDRESVVDGPLVISTWIHGIEANAAAWEVLSVGGNALNAVEKGVSVTESDLTNRSVGLGGSPDRDGKVTLDACIMDEKSRCGSVAFLQHIDHPIQVARKVMENTPHVMLVGQGAYQFALENGFERSKVDVPLPGPKKAWEKWMEKSKYQPVINIENHDTIGMIAIDKNRNLSGACTTSGMAYKLHGRVGDSPIIGAGLFVDNEVGAATATGVGEAVIRIAGSHTVVELMRAGATPTEACKEAVERIIRKHDNVDDLQVGFIAIDKKGRHGGYSVYNGFNYAIRSEKHNEMIDVMSDRNWK